jgi:hypothetical protein
VAENRTFIFKGLAYGSTPVSLQAVIGNTTVFSGAVATTDAPLPVTPPDPSAQAALFSFTTSELNTDFAGSVPMQVAVTGGNGCVMGEVNGNWYVGNVMVPSEGTYGTASSFTLNYGGQPTNSESTVDTRSSVYIDGDQQVPPCLVSTGCWNWIVPTGSFLSYNFNVNIGMVGNVIGNTSNYTGSFTPVPNYPTPWPV